MELTRATIAEENEAFELTDAQKRELDKRLESARSNPGQGRTWDEIKTEFLKQRVSSKIKASTLDQSQYHLR